MLKKIVSGGQTGADQAAWRAAKAHGIATGGWMPKGFLTEEGERPEFEAIYGASEMPAAKYPPRTKQNARESDATLWFGAADSAGANTTIEACRRFGKPCFLVRFEPPTMPYEVARWLKDSSIEILHIAGNRESTSPGIGISVERFLEDLFRILTDRFE